MPRKSRRALSPVFGPMVALEDRLTPSGAMESFIGPLPHGAAPPESILTGPRDDRDGVLLYTRTEIMAGLTGAAPLADLAGRGELAGWFDLGGSRIILDRDGEKLAELKLQPGI